MRSDRPGTSESCWPGFKPARGRERLRKSKLNTATKSHQHMPWFVGRCTYRCVVFRLRRDDETAGVTSLQFLIFCIQEATKTVNSGINTALRFRTESYFC
jgi:hypothetical protein